MCFRVTVEDIMAHNPCYSEEELRLYIGNGRTIEELPTLPIPVSDILWVLHTCDMLPVKQLLLLSADFAEEVLPLWKHFYPYDIRPMELLLVKKGYLNRVCTQEEYLTREYILWSDGVMDDSSKQTERKILKALLDGASLDMPLCFSTPRTVTEAVVYYHTHEHKLTPSKLARKLSGLERRQRSILKKAITLYLRRAE